MKAVITGATGSIGKHLVNRLLDMDWDVLAIARGDTPAPESWNNAKIQIIYLDITDEEGIYHSIKEYDVMFHLAASQSNDWHESIRVNVDGTRSVVSAVLRAGLKKFVHFSSIAVYSLSDYSPGMTITEECARHQDDRSMGPYYHTKSLAEDVVLEMCHAANFRPAIVRPGIVLDSNRSCYFQELGYRLPFNGLAIVSDKNRELPLIGIECLIDGILSCLDIADEAPEVFNLLASDGVTIKKYLEWTVTHRSFPRYSIRLPYALPWVAALAYECCARLGIVKPGRISRAQIAWKQANVKYRSDRAQCILGWKGISIDQ